MKSCLQQMKIVAQFSALLGEISQAAQDNTIEKRI